MKYFFLILILLILIGCNNLFFNYNNEFKHNIQAKSNIQLINNININESNIDVIGTKVIKEIFVDYNNISNNKNLDEFNDIVNKNNNYINNNEINIDIQKLKQLTQSADDLITLVKNNISIDAINVLYNDEEKTLSIQLKDDFKEMINEVIEMYFILKSSEIKDIDINNNFKKELLNGIIKIYKIDVKPIFNSQQLVNIKIYLDKDLKNLEISNIVYVIKKDNNIIKKQNKDIIIK